MRTAAPVVVLLLVGAAGACGGDDGEGDAETGGEALAERLVAVLEGAGADRIDGDLDGADVTCPRLDDPQPGDRATCVVEPRRGGEVEVDVEFDTDGSIAVVAMVPG